MQLYFKRQNTITDDDLRKFVLKVDILNERRYIFLRISIVH